LTPNELVLTFGGLHLCVKFGVNRQRNATVRVTTIRPKFRLRIRLKFILAEENKMAIEPNQKWLNYYVKNRIDIYN